MNVLYASRRHKYLYLYMLDVLVPPGSQVSPGGISTSRRYKDGSWERDRGIAMLTVHTYIYSKTSLNQPTMGPASHGPFKEVVGLMR